MYIILVLTNTYYMMIFRMCFFILVYFNLFSCDNKLTKNGKIDTIVLNDKMLNVVENLSTLDVEQDTFRHIMKVSYIGKIGNYPIEMEINILPFNKTIDGTYNYKKRSDAQDIFCDGMMDNNTIQLKEYYYKNGNKVITGKFNLEPIDVGKLKGIWTNPDNSKSYLVELTCLDSINLMPVTYTYMRDIKTVEMERYPDSGDKQTFQQLTQVRVYDKSNLIQTIKNLNIIVSSEDNLEFEDLNFDGYLDLKIIEHYPFGIKPDYGVIHFIYNPFNNKFEPSKVLNDLRVVKCNSFKKQISHYTADGRGNESESFYRWEGNSLRIFKEITYTEDSNDPIITEYP